MVQHQGSVVVVLYTYIYIYIILGSSLTVLITLPYIIISIFGFDGVVVEA